MSEPRFLFRAVVDAPEPSPLAGTLPADRFPWEAYADCFFLIMGEKTQDGMTIQSTAIVPEPGIDSTHFLILAWMHFTESLRDNPRVAPPWRALFSNILEPFQNALEDD